MYSVDAHVSEETMKYFNSFYPELHVFYAYGRNCLLV